MAWVKVPKENHPIFLDALPSAPDIATMPMFGGICVTVNGNIAGGLFGRSVMLRLTPEQGDEVLAMEGGAYFDPMGRGMQQPGKVMLPEETLNHPAELRAWLDKAIALARTLPPKAKGAKKASSAPKKAPGTPKSAKPAAKSAAKSAPAKKAKPATKRAKPAAKRAKPKKRR